MPRILTLSLCRSSAWSNKTEAKERKLDRRLKKDRKKDYLKRKQENDDDDDDDDDKDDWDELAKEERLAKKMRKGKITRQDFDTMMGDDLDLVE